MFKIDLKKLAASIAKVAVPVVIGAVLTHRSVKGALIDAAKDAARQEVAKRFGEDAALRSVLG